MTVANRREIREVLSQANLPYHTVKGSEIHVLPSDVTPTGDQTVVLYDANGNPLLDALGRIPVSIERNDLDVVQFVLAAAAVGARSDEIDIGGMSMGIIMMPSAWTAANITFQIGQWSGGTFLDLYDENGSEVVVTAAAGRAIPIPPEVVAARFIKVRSGTTGTPVAQAADRQFQLILKG